jgi:hypothetical protein
VWRSGLRRLVPEDIIFGLLTKRLEDGYNKGETGFILDGIPRTRMQAVSTLYAQTIWFSYILVPCNLHRGWGTKLLPEWCDWTHIWFVHYFTRFRRFLMRLWMLIWFWISSVLMTVSWRSDQGVTSAPTVDSSLMSAIQHLWTVAPTLGVIHGILR